MTSPEGAAINSTTIQVETVRTVVTMMDSEKMSSSAAECTDESWEAEGGIVKC
jgi:hypothetical protein